MKVWSKCERLETHYLKPIEQSYRNRISSKTTKGFSNGLQNYLDDLKKIAYETTRDKTSYTCRLKKDPVNYTDKRQNSKDIAQKIKPVLNQPISSWICQLELSEI